MGFYCALLNIKVSRPSFIPFWGEISIEKRVPLHLVIDIIIEQGISLKFLLVFLVLCVFIFEL